MSPASARLPAGDLDHVMAHTRGLWEDLRGKRLFVTGGTGFFGCWLLESFLRADDELRLGAKATVLTRDPAAFRAKAPHVAGNPAISLLAGDVRDFAFPDGEFAFVIHAASSSATRPEESLASFDAAVDGTRRVLDFAVARGTRRLLFTSSGAVYGKQPPELTRVAEDYAGAPDPTDPKSAYGEGKRAAELLCATCFARHGVETTIARCFAFAGPHLPLDSNYAVGNFVRDALRGGPIRIAGDGTPYRSYLYAADLAAWLWTILLRGKPARPYNVGSEADVTIAELAREVAAAVAPKAEVLIAQAPVPGSPAARYVPSTIRARTELGLDAWVQLGEGIRRTADWYRPPAPKDATRTRCHR